MKALTLEKVKSLSQVFGWPARLACGCLFSMGLLVISGQRAVFAQSAATPMTISDSRPIAKAVEELESRYGYVITYEDPVYTYADDVVDVTAQVNRYYGVGKQLPVVVPVGGAVTLRLPAGPAVSSDALEKLLGQLVQQQLTHGSGGHFQVRQAGGEFHIVPSEIRDRNGQWVSQRSILDVPISIPLQVRYMRPMLTAICDAVSAAAHVKVTLGTGAEIDNAIPSYSLAATNEPARTVLIRALATISPKLSWALFYGPEPDNAYALNITYVPSFGAGEARSASGVAGSDGQKALFPGRH